MRVVREAILHDLPRIRRFRIRLLFGTPRMFLPCHNLCTSIIANLDAESGDLTNAFRFRIGPQRFICIGSDERGGFTATQATRAITVLRRMGWVEESVDLAMEHWRRTGFWPSIWSWEGFISLLFVLAFALLTDFVPLFQSSRSCCIYMDYLSTYAQTFLRGHFADLLDRAILLPGLLEHVNFVAIFCPVRTYANSFEHINFWNLPLDVYMLYFICY